ncbi:hypothetical protein P7C70_g1457, partial [Phenoliferia sp. Uapishka_3]
MTLISSLTKHISSSSLLNPLHAPLTGPPVSAPRPPQLNPLASLRHAHILRLHDLIYHLLSLPPSQANSNRTLRAWRALASCKEVDIDAIWKLGGKVVERVSDGAEDEREDYMARKAAWIKACQDNRLAKVEKTVEYCLALVAAGQPTQAHDELDTLLPAHPYNESITLNVLGGFLALFLSQPPEPRVRSRDTDSESKSDSSYISDSSDSDSSSGDDNGKEELDTDEEAARRVVVQEKSRKRLHRGDETGARKAVIAHLQSCQRHSPGNFELAKQRFRRAAYLESNEDSEDSEAEENNAAPRKDKGGEGTRWLSLLDFDLEGRERKKRRGSGSE